MKVVTKNNVILSISNKADWVINGIDVGDYIIGVSKQNNEFVGELPIIKDIEVPKEVTPQKYCYEESKGFYLNPNYIDTNQVLKDNSIAIKKTTETTQPSEVTVTDQTDHWNIKVVRNITSQVVNEVTYYTYEYIESSAPKDTRTQAEIQAIALSRKNDFFTRAEYPIATIYDDTKSSSDLMKIIFAIMDKNDALTQRVATLEGGH